MKSPLKRAQALDRVKDEQLGTENHIVKVSFVETCYVPANLGLTYAD